MATHVVTMLHKMAPVRRLAGSTRWLSETPTAAPATANKNCNAMATTVPARMAPQLMRVPTDKMSSARGVFSCSAMAISLPFLRNRRPDEMRAAGTYLKKESGCSPAIAAAAKERQDDNGQRQSEDHRRQAEADPSKSFHFLSEHHC